MKYCDECKRPLRTPLDEYGPPDAPLCQYHFLKGSEWIVDNPQSNLEMAKSDLENIKSDVQDQIELLEALKNNQNASKAHVADEEEHLGYLQSRMEMIQNGVSSLEKRVEEMKQADARKLEAWKASVMA